MENIVEVDSEKGKIEFQNYCEACGCYEGTYLTFIFLLEQCQELEDNFYKSNILFAHGNYKNPLIIIGPDTYRKLKREKMKGLYFDPIYR